MEEAIGLVENEITWTYNIGGMKRSCTFVLKEKKSN